MMHEANETSQDPGVGGGRDLVGGQRERLDRYERALRFAREIEAWPSSKLRAAYAQPEKVRRAEERERSQVRPPGQ